MDPILVTFDNVLVEPEIISKSAGGIIIPDSDKSKQRPVIGKIVGIGPGVDRDGVFVKTTHKKGQRIALSQYPRTDLEVDGKILYVISERQILGVFREGSK